VLAAAAALVALAGSVGVVVGRRTVDGRGDLRTASILARDGRQVGEVSVHDGTSSWCLVSVSSPRRHQRYVHARLRDGRTVPIQTFSVRDGVGSYGSHAGARARHVEMRLVAPAAGCGPPPICLRRSRPT
jgi:hypothetical protein